MRCLSRIAPSLRGTFSCQSGSPRPYSFSAEIAQLLNSFQETPSVPPIIPANRKILAEFQQNVANPKVTTWYLTKQYNLLHRNSSLRVLPASTANDYLVRLFRDRDIKTTVKILLEYDLDEAVLVATKALAQLSLNEKEFCLFSLQQGLANVRQSGLMNQIMVELGYMGTRLDAFKRLVIVHENMMRCETQETLKDVQELCLLLSQRMRGDASGGRINTRSVLVLMKQSIQIHTAQFSRELCRQNWHAKEAIELYLNVLTDSQSLQVLVDDAPINRELWDPSQKDDCAPAKIFVRKIKKIKEPERLRPLYELQLPNTSVRHAIAQRMSTARSCMDASIKLASTASPVELASLLFEWTSRLGASEDDETANLVTAITKLLGTKSSSHSEIMSHYLRLIASATDGQLHQYEFSLLIRVLKFFDAFPGALSEAVQQQVSKQFVNRPYHETSEYFKLQKTNPRHIEGLVGHHLNLLRIQDRRENPRKLGRSSEGLLQGDSDPSLISTNSPSSEGQIDAPPNQDKLLQSVEFFVESFSILRNKTVETRANYTHENLAHSYENILRNLLQISTSLLAVNFLLRTHKLGHTLPPDLAPFLIRALSQNPTSRQNIGRVLRFYPGTIMTYDIYARYISRISQTAPVTAMATLDLMMTRKGHVPRRRLLQNLMLGISRCETISESRAFRYLVRIVGLAGSHGISMDRIQLSSLLRVVLVRQGLGAATSRLSWLLNLSMTLSMRETRIEKDKRSHEALTAVLRKWRIHEQVRGDGTGRLRPKKLREVLDGMSARQSVIHTRRLARGNRVPK